MDTENGKKPEAKAIAEALLFAREEPLPVETMARIMEMTVEEVKDVLKHLEEDMGRAERGLRLYRTEGGYRIGTAPDMALYVEKLFTKEVTGPLTGAALETMAIIAYKQPVTRLEVEAIRGVNSDGVIDGLLKRKLIKVAGRRDTLGRPLLFGTTGDFLKYFGLKDLSELPSLKDSEDIT